VSSCIISISSLPAPFSPPSPEEIYCADSSAPEAKDWAVLLCGQVSEETTAKNDVRGERPRIEIFVTMSFLQFQKFIFSTKK
jgi:hypothetical protein